VPVGHSPVDAVHGVAQLAPASFTAPGIEPLPVELLPLRSLSREAFGARRDPRREWFEARGIARDWSAQVRHTQAGLAAAGLPDPDPRQVMAETVRAEAVAYRRPYQA
jgi:hypothetical protein